MFFPSCSLAHPKKYLQVEAGRQGGRFPLVCDFLIKRSGHRAPRCKSGWEGEQGQTAPVLPCCVVRDVCSALPQVPGGGAAAAQQGVPHPGLRLPLPLRQHSPLLQGR